MKKIVSAALLAAMVAGAASAEVKVSSNFRIRPVLAEWNMGTEADTLARYFDLDSVQGAADTLTFDAKADYAGVKLVYNTSISKNTISIDTFNGYVKFGALTFTGGLFDSRIANRVTKDQNNLSFIEQNWGPTYNDAKVKAADVYETNKTNNKFAGTKKLGVNPNSPLKGKAIGVDSDNITAIEGTKALSFVADYVFADLGGGDLQVWAALNKNADEWPTANDDGVKTVEVDSSYAFRVAYTMKDTFAVDADLHIVKQGIVAALFFSPLMVENLESTLGFTFGKAEEGAGEDADTAIAIDARFRYAIDKAMAVGLYFNFTNVNVGDDAAIDSCGTVDTVLNFNYALNDLVKVFVEGEFVMFTNSDVKDAYGSQLAAQLGAIFTAGKGAELDVAARLAMAGIGADQDKDLIGMQISIPMVMRVKL